MKKVHFNVVDATRGLSREFFHDFKLFILLYLFYLLYVMVGVDENKTVVVYKCVDVDFISLNRMSTDNLLFITHCIPILIMFYLPCIVSPLTSLMLNILF